MIYNLSKEIDLQRFKERSKFLIDKGKKVELKERRRRKTVSQNAYLHLILTWFGIETGYTLQEAKELMKRYVCAEDFKYQKNGRWFVRSLADDYFDTKRTTIVIDKFRNWSQVEAGIYLPSPNEKEFLEHIETQMRAYGQKQYL